jgi:glutathione synthase/RimK-type ligase-like ATP-grasp enzyme
VKKPRIGVINRYTADKRRGYPLGLALDAIGAAYVPIDVRAITAALDEDGDQRLLAAEPAGQPARPLAELGLDGVLWRVSEDSFGAYAGVQWTIARRYPLVNRWQCARICADKWRTSTQLAAAGIRVVPTVLLTPGMTVPRFPGFQTVIKPCVGAGGRGVRVAAAGTQPDLAEPHVAQPLIPGPAEEQVRALVCRPSSVLAMIRLPGEASPPDLPQVNNLEAGGVPAPTGAAPIRDIAVAAATCLGGDLLGVDLVWWQGGFAVLEVNASPGLEGIAQVSDEDCYRLAAESVLYGLREQRAAGVTPPA